MIALLLMGCLSESSVDLDIFIEGDALRATTFPAQLVVDFSEDVIRAVDLCSYEGEDFFELELPTVDFDGCRRSEVTIVGALAPLEGECEQGLVRRRLDAVPAEATWTGRGEVIVFSGASCEYEEQRVLAIDAIP